MDTQKLSAATFWLAQRTRLSTRKFWGYIKNRWEETSEYRSVLPASMWGVRGGDASSQSSSLLTRYHAEPSPCSTRKSRLVYVHLDLVQERTLLRVRQQERFPEVQRPPEREEWERAHLCLSVRLHQAASRLRAGLQPQGPRLVAPPAPSKPSSSPLSPLNSVLLSHLEPLIFSAKKIYYLDPE